MGVFTYSHEEGSPAFNLKDSISLKEKHNRREELMKIQEDISLSINQEKIGKQLKVVIDREEGEYFIGRTEADSPEVDNEVLIKGNMDGFWPGYFYNARIISADSFDLYAEIV
jgi:ribosomal protein S12 methylthiotransferase